MERVERRKEKEKEKDERNIKAKIWKEDDFEREACLCQSIQSCSFLSSFFVLRSSVIYVLRSALYTSYDYSYVPPILLFFNILLLRAVTWRISVEIMRNTSCQALHLKLFCKVFSASKKFYSRRTGRGSIR